MYIYMYICVYIYMYICIHIYMSIFTYISNLCIEVFELP